MSSSLNDFLASKIFALVAIYLATSFKLSAAACGLELLAPFREAGATIELAGST